MTQRKEPAGVRKSVIAATILLLLVGAGARTSGKENRHDVLGITVGMSHAAARAQLEKVGRKVREDRKQQEIWEVNDPRFSHVIVGFTKGFGQLRYVTGKARPDGKRLRYSDVGDIKNARRVVTTGNYEYTWAVPARDGLPAYVVVARGTDPDYLLYYSIKKMD